MNYFKRVFVILVIFIITSVTGYTNPKAENFNFNSSEKTTFTQSSSFTGTLTYVRVFKDSKWWIYVYDGISLLDKYPE